MRINNLIYIFEMKPLFSMFLTLLLLSTAAAYTIAKWQSYTPQNITGKRIIAN